MDDIKLFAKNKENKSIGNSNTRSENKQSGLRNGTWPKK